jgi:hypothetical protein
VTHSGKRKKKKKKREGKKEGEKEKKKEKKKSQGIRKKCTFQQNFSKFSPPAELPAGGGRGGRVPLRGTLHSPA